MTPLPDEPVVVVHVEGEKISFATNISPNTMLILCDTKEQFDKYAQGKPFCNPIESRI